MIYSRLILKELEKELNTREIIVLTGMRQTGKTTILEYLFDKTPFKNKAIFDLSNPLHRKVFEEENYDNIWPNLAEYDILKEKKTCIFLDEIQNLPDITKVVKYFYDHWSVKFFLTGSSSYYLKNLFSESLSGRKIIFELYPLTFEEFLIFKGISREFKKSFKDKAKSKNKISFEKYKKYHDEYMQYGGFPAVVLTQSRKRKTKLIEQIFKSYFEIDVKTLADVGNIAKLRDLILLLVPRIGSKIDITKLSSELSLSRETIYNYLSFLEQTYFISLVRRFSKSRDRTIAGSKKLYFADCGLGFFLGRISEGQLFEQSIFQNLRYHKELNYYSNDTTEIDFIVDQKIALEVKVSPSKKDISFLRKKSKNLNLREFYIISKNYGKEKEIIQTIDL